MPGIDDSARLELRCPQCQAKFRKTIRELKRPGVKCPKCGTGFNTSELKKALNRIDRELKDFQGKFGAIKIRL